MLRPIFEKEMLNGLIALPGAYDILEYCKSREIKTAVLTNKYGPMPEQFARISNLTNTWSSLLVQMIPSGKNLIQN